MAAILGCLSIIITLGVWWISKTFGNDVYLEQMIWHLTESSLAGVDSNYIKRGAKFSLMMAALCGMWILVSYPRRLLHALRKLPFLKKIGSCPFFEGPKYPLLLFSASALYFIGLGIFVDIKFYIHEYIYIYFNADSVAETYLQRSRGDMIKKNYSVPSRGDIFFERKQDLVIVLAESMETSFNDPVLGEPLMPRMGKFQARSQYNDNFMNVFGTNWTVAAMAAWFFGLPLRVAAGPGEAGDSPAGAFLPGAESIFDILREHGYELVFILGSSREFTRKDALFSGHGGFTVMDREFFEKQGWSLARYGGTGWGFSDAFVFERALEEYRKLRASGKPFVLFVETVDTHAPGGFCPPERRRYDDIRDAIVELDRNLAAFSEAIWNDDVAYIVLGDHLFMGNPDFLERVERRRIFNLFHGNLPAIPEKKRHQHVSALDMAPTLLQAAGARWKNDQFGLGVSLFSEEPSLLEGQGTTTFNWMLRSWSPFYSTLQ